MINVNTVLILGAVASIPYDFPSGLKLLDEIVEEQTLYDKSFRDMVDQKEQEK